MATKTELEQQVRALVEERAKAAREAADAVKALDDFKKKVVEVGGRYAEENDYCDDYDEMMAELGLSAGLRPSQVRARVTVSFDLKSTWDLSWSEMRRGGKTRPTSAEEFQEFFRLDEGDFFDPLTNDFSDDRITNFKIKVTDFESGAAK